MKLLIIIIFLPILIFSQSIVTNVVQSEQSAIFHKNLHLMPIPKGQIDYDRSSSSSMYTNMFFLYANTQVKQENEGSSGEIFKKEYLQDISNTKRRLQLSFYLKYGANIISIISQLKSYEGVSFKKSLDENAPLIDLSKRSTFLNILDFSTYALELQSINSIGLSGNSLFKLSTRFSKTQSLALYDASKKLQQARTFGLIGEGLSILGSTIAFYGLGQRLDSDTFNRSMIIGGSFGLGAFIFKYIAIKKIGSAGDDISHFSDNISDNLQKDKFQDFGKSLIEYEANWKNGLTLKISGAALIVLSPFLTSANTSNSFAIGTMIGGSILILIGNIYTEWVAPYALENAGEKLSDIEHVLQQ